MIYGILIAFHIMVCVMLILVVLLQSGKGGGLAGAFGGAGGQTGQVLFGGRGAATFLSKATTGLGIAFLTTSLVLAIMASQRSGPRSVIRQAEAPGTIAPPIDAPAPGPGDNLTLPGADVLADPGQAQTPSSDQAPSGTDTPSDEGAAGDPPAGSDPSPDAGGGQ